MNSRTARIDTGITTSFTVSAVIHLAFFLFLLWGGHLFSPQMPLQETYYVDIVNMPVASPQHGDSAQKPPESDLATPAISTPPPATTSTFKTAPKSISKALKPSPPKESAENEAAFAERMAKLEGKAEAQQLEEKLKRLSKTSKTSSNKKVGILAAGGTEAGSSYGDFIKSRLEDALKITSYSTTKNPEVVVRITISADGKLLHMKIERSSGDAAFELAVRRAIDLASQKFPPTPDHKVFENGFFFKPKGISKGSQR